MGLSGRTQKLYLMCKDLYIMQSLQSVAVNKFFLYIIVVYMYLLIRIIMAMLRRM